jgi:trehalose 6-phosphate synthase
MALEMPPAERRARMQRMRQQVREHNVFRWAGLLVGALARIPSESLDTARAPGGAVLARQ